MGLIKLLLMLDRIMLGLRLRRQARLQQSFRLKPWRQTHRDARVRHLFLHCVRRRVGWIT